MSSSYASSISSPKERPSSRTDEENEEMLSFDGQQQFAGQKPHSNKPLDTPFRQQRLPAWRPILAPQNVIPVLFCIAIIFIPLGILFLSSSANVQEYVFNYTDCLKKASSNRWTPANSGSSKGNSFEWQRKGEDICKIRFQITKEMSGPVFLYYKLTKFYQNNRLYLKSISYKQLRGEAVERSELSDDCDPLSGPDNSSRVYYPCGLIGNSYFSDKYSPMKNLETGREIEFIPKGITWSADSHLFKPSAYRLDQIAPPPYWIKGFPEWIDKDGNYKVVPPLWKDERFQVWMRAAAMPTFRKLYGKYDFDIQPGAYEIEIRSNYNVTDYNGTKSVVISTSSWIGGKNRFLGIAYLVIGGFCVVVGLFFLAKHMIFPRRMGDYRYLSWNQHQHFHRFPQLVSPTAPEAPHE